MKWIKKFYIFELEGDQLILWDDKGYLSETEAMEVIGKFSSDYMGTLRLIVLPIWTNK